MVAQLKATAARAQGAAGPAGLAGPLAPETPAARADFAGALKATLEQVSAAQQKSQALGQRFAAGDDSVNLSDAMIAMQKASIAFQATVQVRNKLVAAYQDIMNMQV